MMQLAVDVLNESCVAIQCACKRTGYTILCTVHHDTFMLDADRFDGLPRQCPGRKLIPPNTSANTLKHRFTTNYLAGHSGGLVSLGGW